MMERNEKILLDQVTASDAKLENFRQGLANKGTPQIVIRKTPKPTRLEGKRGEAEQDLREVVNYVGGESDQNKDELCRIAIAYFGKAPNDLFHGLYPTYQELFWTHWPTLKAEIIRNYGDHLVHSSAEEQLMKIR